MTAKVVLLDIETSATRDPRLIDMIRREAIAKEPASNTKTELKATWNSEAARERRAREALDKTAVNVLYAEVLCVGVIIDDQEPRIYSSMGPGATEQLMLGLLAHDLREITSSDTVWAGHNIEAFDLPILVNRLRRHGIVPPEAFPQPHHGKMRGRIYDTMQRIPSGHGLGMVSMHDACLAYGLPEPKTRLALPDGRPMCGALVGEALALGGWELIEQYCLEDMEATRALYRACTVGGEWGTWEADAEIETAISAVWQSAGLGRDKQSSIVLEILAETGKIPRRFARAQVA